MKKITKSLIAVFAALGLTFTATPAVNAEPADQQVVAIIDAGFEAERFGDSVILEACVLAFSFGCNTISKGLEIGPGAAGTENELKPRYHEDWNHGNLMAEAVLKANPNAKLILIRNGKVYNNVMGKATTKDFDAAMEWVANNAEKYGIDAVSYSMANHRYVFKGGGNVAIYQRIVNIYTGIIDRYKAMGMSPNVYSRLQAIVDRYQAKIDNAGTITCPVPNKTVNNIEDLANKGIPTFIAAGNNADKIHVSEPACVEEAMTVSSGNGAGGLLGSSNFSKTLTDFIVTAPNTSTATAKMAGLWTANSGDVKTSVFANSNALLVAD